ncbi:MAG: hypothetical protein FOGNACKC_03206 [Anaerolineae bacterium]|nr:hypothetical protein [Anaerolineae bacterium]
MDRRDQIPHLAFYQFQLNKDQNEHLGGTGIYLTSFLNFLKSQENQVQIRYILNKPTPHTGNNLWRKALSFFRKQWQDTRDLLWIDDEILLFHYPKMPFIGRSGAIKVLLFAVLGYGLLGLKKKITGQRIVVLIQDLPTEQKLIPPTETEPDLNPFYSLRTLPWPHRYFTLVERLIFKIGDTIISPSNLLTGHIIKKHNLTVDKIKLKRRDIYMPSYEAPPQKIQLDPADKIRAFYSGDLGLAVVQKNLLDIIKVFAINPQAGFYLCGRHGEWLTQEIKERDLKNVHYFGVLDHATHDAVARQCDIGLLLYQHSYYDLMATAKYSAYVANKLVILSTNLITLSTIINEDKVGFALPASKLPAQLNLWLQHNNQINQYKNNCQELQPSFFNGTYMEGWFRESIGRQQSVN